MHFPFWRHLPIIIDWLIENDLHFSPFVAILSQLRSHGPRKCINMRVTLIDQWDKSQLWYMYFPIGWWTSHKSPSTNGKIDTPAPGCPETDRDQLVKSIVLRWDHPNDFEARTNPTKGLRLLPRGHRDRRCNAKSQADTPHSRGRGRTRWTCSPTGSRCRVGAQRIFICNYSARKGSDNFYPTSTNSSRTCMGENYSVNWAK